MKQISRFNRYIRYAGANGRFILAATVALAALLTITTPTVTNAQETATNDEAAITQNVDTAASRSSAERNPDPFERFNRTIFRFNDRLDRAVLKPVAQRYVKHVPPSVRRGVKNFTSNLREPTTIVNDILQGKLVQAGEDTLRFAVNSVFGLLGIFDVASAMNLNRNREDFGQTFAKWGMPSGPYLVLPFLGPSNLRDATGLIPQYTYTDLTSGIDEDALVWTIFGARIIDTRSDLLKADRILAEQLDPYAFIRETYTQQRLNQIYDGQIPEEEDEFLDELLREGN
ncbi:MAG: hypothetical protein DHS20C01_31530 [marine bacterium B5-7]|nr:MAG: hypothetical protein DHS20C01_31530 [marine bacterium B5-7]